MVNVLWREIVARVVDIGGVVDHHYLYILIMIKIISKKKKIIMKRIPFIH
jgi:hypothetical protein